MSEIPSGTVTFLFTDIEGSTELWSDAPDAMGASLRRHDEILKKAIAENRGYVFSTGGDGFAVAFSRTRDAVAAALSAQQDLDAEQWPNPAELRVRMGIHTGEVEERDGDYFGMPVNIAARVMGLASGRQILLSGVSADLVRDHVSLVERGQHAVKGVPDPVTVWAVGTDILDAGGPSPEPAPGEAHAFGNYVLDPRTRTLGENGTVIPVEPQVFDVLHYLIANRDRAVSKEELLDAVWGDQFVGESALSTRIKSARRAVGDDGKRQEVIKTLHGHGFRFVAPVQSPAAASVESTPTPTARTTRRALAEAPTELFGRNSALGELNDAMNLVHGGSGQVVVVRGEPGLGKTALLQTFLDSLPTGEVQVAAAGCVSLRTPEPLAPIEDLADQLGVDQNAVSDEASASTISKAIVAELDRSSDPSVLVIEDLHWGDDATLDAVAFLGRRLPQCRALLILSTRPSETGSANPLLGILADLRSSGAILMELEPLTSEALGDWAEAVGAEAPQLIEYSGGNALLASEILRSPGAEVPEGVRDSVAGRLARLSESGRRVVETLAMSPQPLEIPVVMRVLDEDFGALAEVERAGLVAARGETVAFQHELVRMAVHDSVSTFSRVSTHRTLFDALTEKRSARAIHHAAEALMTETVAELAPPAARRATEVQAHRQAKDLYERSLNHVELYDDVQAALLRADYARTLYILWDLEAAERAASEAISLLEGLDQPLALGDTMTTMARVQLWLGMDQSFNTITEAIAILETQPPGRELCRAYCEAAGILVVGDLIAEADNYASTGYDLAVELGDRALQGLALNYSGSANLVESRQTALRHALELLDDSRGRDYAGRVYSNLIVTLWELGELQQAADLLVEAQERLAGVEYTSAVMNVRLQGAHINKALGRLDEALAHLEWVATTALAASFEYEVSLLNDHIHMRMGDSAARQRIRQRWGTRHSEARLAKVDSTRSAGHLSRYPMLQLMTVTAEVALRDRDTALAAEVAEVANAETYPPTWIESRHILALYLSLAGQSVNFASDATEPYLSALNGDTELAASGFDDVGRVFEAQACRGELE